MTSAPPLANLSQRVDALLASQPQVLADPFPLYREIRNASRVYQHGPMVFLTRYDDVKLTIGDGVGFSNHGWMKGSRAKAIRAGLAPEHRIIFDEVAGFESNSIARSDNPQHARLRAISHRAFTPRRVEALASAIQRYTDETLDELAAEAGTVDFMRFAYRVPLWVISDLLGIPPGDREMVHSWSLRIARNRGGAELDFLIDAHSAHHEIRGYVAEVVDRHRRAPDSTSEIVASLLDAEAGDRLTTDELTAMFVVLVVAGHETTTNLISIGLFELLRRPEQWMHLVDHPEDWPGAVEELLRFVTPAQWIPRYARVDIGIGDDVIPQGTTVIPLLPEANRDPAVFEDPDRLDVRRADSRRHLAFGHGPHFCLGASLARLEALIAFSTVSRRFPNIALADEPLEWTGHAVLRRLSRLPVTLAS